MAKEITPESKAINMVLKKEVIRTSNIAKTIADSSGLSVLKNSLYTVQNIKMLMIIIYYRTSRITYSSSERSEWMLLG